MTPISNWGAGTIAFIGDTDGLPPIPPEDPVEEDSDYVQQGVNISVGGNGVRNPSSGFFNRARNFSIVGGTFSTYPGDAHVFQSWSSPGTAMNASSHAGPRRQSQAAMDLEAEWDGSRVDASSSNGNVQVAYDDEDAFGLSGKWKSDLPSRHNGGGGGGGGVRSNFVIAAGDWPSWTGFMGVWA